MKRVFLYSAFVILSIMILDSAFARPRGKRRAVITAVRSPGKARTVVSQPPPPVATPSTSAVVNVQPAVQAVVAAPVVAATSAVEEPVVEEEDYTSRVEVLQLEIEELETSKGAKQRAITTKTSSIETLKQEIADLQKQKSDLEKKRNGFKAAAITTGITAGLATGAAIFTGVQAAKNKNEECCKEYALNGQGSTQRCINWLAKEKNVAKCQ